MKRPFKLEVLWSWVLLTQSRRSFERDPDRHRSVMWAGFQNNVLSKSPKYRHHKGQALEAFPVQEKLEFMRDFDQINTRGLTLDEAMEVAVQSEQSRDFAPTLNGVTVGLSSGTSGNRGLFLASEKERAMWVAAVLQRILGWSFRKRKVAFFLRANSNLYSSVQSNLIAFEFFDLLQPLDGHVTRLNQLQPDVLVGQPSLLIRLAKAQRETSLSIAPTKVISVAEVLSPEDERVISETFGVRVDQVYQCTEGLLGQTCPHGTMHLNEDWLLVEQEWLDEKRFIPVVTDLRRSSQPVVRYRMNDILHAGTCTCGSRTMAISRIEGRMDDVMVLQGDVTVFPDFVRRAIAGAHPDIREYQVVQLSRTEISLFIPDSAHWDLANQALQALFDRLGTREIVVNSAPSLYHHDGSKLRRILALRS